MKRILFLSLLAIPLGCGAASPSESTQPSEQPIIACGSSALRVQSHEVCEPMDAKAIPDAKNGSCGCILGFAWDGSACVGLGDCYCQGKDCNKLAQSEAECEAAHAQCGQPPSVQRLSCSDSNRFAKTHDVCAKMDAKAAPDPEHGSCNCFLGFAWDGSACVDLADCDCEGSDCDKLTMDKAACEAAHAQCGGAPLQRLSCSDSKLRSVKQDGCAKMEAKAVPDEQGSCGCILGFAWDGAACVLLGDCYCEGKDCDKLTLDKAECEAAHAQCIP